MLLLGAALRLVALGSQDLWFDEVHTYTDALLPSSNSSVHALFFRITKAVLDSGAAFGLSRDTLLRLFPAACGTLAVVVVWRLCTILCGRGAGLAAAAVFALSSYQVMYAREARFYAPLVFLCALAWWAVAEFSEQRRPWRWALLAIVPSALYLAFRMQPTAAPFAGAMVLWLSTMMAWSDRGLPSLLGRIPQIAGGARSRLASLALVVLALAALSPMGFALVRRNVPKLEVSAERLEQLSPAFLWQHMLDLGAGISEGPLALAAGVLFALFALVGVASLAKRAPLWLAAAVGTIAATFLAIVVVPSRLAPQTKYVIYLAVPLAVLAAEGVAHLLRSGKFRPALAFVGTLLALQAIPVLRAATGEKMAVRPQFEWLNRNASRGAVIFINGHVGIPAGLYADTLDPALRKRIHYMPFDDESTHLKAEVIRSHARAGIESYFVWAWPWDVPESLSELLDAQGEVVAAWPSIRGHDYDCRLVRIPPAPVPAPTDTLELRGGQVAGYSRLADLDGEETPDGVDLVIRSSGAVEYLAPLRPGEWSIEIHATAQAGGLVVLAVEPAGGRTVYLSRKAAGPQPITLRGILHVEASTDRLVLNHVSDRPAQKGRRGLDQDLRIHSIRLARAVAPEGGQHENEIEFRIADTIAVADGTESLPGWRAATRNVEFEPPDVTGAGRARLLGRRQTALTSPPFAVVGGDLMAIRLRAGLMDCPGTMMNFRVNYFAEDGRPVGREHFMTSYLRNTSSWSPYVDALVGREWEDIHVVKQVPSGAAAATISAFLWPTEDDFPGAPNVVRLGKIAIRTMLERSDLPDREKEVE